MRKSRPCHHCGVAMSPGGSHRRRTEPAARHLMRRGEPGKLRPKATGRWSWEMAVLWGFVVLTFAVFFLAGCALWAKGSGQ